MKLTQIFIHGRLACLSLFSGTKLHIQCKYFEPISSNKLFKVLVQLVKNTLSV